MFSWVHHSLVPPVQDIYTLECSWILLTFSVFQMSEESSIPSLCWTDSHVGASQSPQNPHFQPSSLPLVSHTSFIITILTETLYLEWLLSFVMGNKKKKSEILLFLWYCVTFVFFCFFFWEKKKLLKIYCFSLFFLPLFYKLDFKT